jgi:hypothetical protein
MMMSKQRPWVFAFLMILPVIPLAVLQTAAPDDAPGMRLLIVGLWAAWGVAFSVLYLRRLDEAARLAHRWAWEWGGAIGMAAALLLAMFGWYAAPGLADAFADFVRARSAHPEATAFAYGSAFTVAVAMALYACAWTGWWLSKRGGQ